AIESAGSASKCRCLAQFCIGPRDDFCFRKPMGPSEIGETLGDIVHPDFELWCLQVSRWLSHTERWLSIQVPLSRPILYRAPRRLCFRKPMGPSEIGETLGDILHPDFELWVSAGRPRGEPYRALAQHPSAAVSPNFVSGPATTFVSESPWDRLKSVKLLGISYIQILSHGCLQVARGVSHRERWLSIQVPLSR